MRFHYGPIPEDAGFTPEAETWSTIREPGPIALQLLALPVALGVLLICAALLYLALPRELLTWQGVITIPLLPFLVILLLLTPVHEGLHVLFHPGWGASANSVIGLWLSRGLLYAHYEGQLSRNRFLLVGAAPYLILSWLPIGIIALLRTIPWVPAATPAMTVLSILAILGGLTASGDLLGFGLLAFQVPRTAVVRNKGWRTYWRKPDRCASRSIGPL